MAAAQTVYYLARKVQVEISQELSRDDRADTLSTQKTWKDICVNEGADEAIEEHEKTSQSKGNGKGRTDIQIFLWTQFS
jgi:hypothetical protein